jgi:hypothetical protein
VPFYFRKSVSAGPFRFNFSKGGIGVSVGIRGLRIGTGPRGHYVHAGTGGFYYRATIGNAGRKSLQPPTPAHLTDPGAPHNDVEMSEVDSGDVLLMRDENFSDLLYEINTKGKQIRASSGFGWTIGILGLLSIFAIGPSGFFVVLLSLPAWAVGKWLDSYRRSTVLYYDLGENSEKAYREITDAFDGLKGCDGKWHIEAGGAVQDLASWKRNAGASYLVKRKTTTLTYALPSVIKSNITPPALHVGKQVIYFMPDVALLTNGNRMGAVSYAELRVRWQDSRFIESGAVPRDAKVVDHTWQHPNKSGGPDRRFKSNRQIPICLYEAMHLQSDSGVNELLEFSQTGRVPAFMAGCRSMANIREDAAQTRPKLTFENQNSALPAVEYSRKGSSGMAVGGGLIVAGLAFFAFVGAYSNKSTSSSSAPINQFPSAFHSESSENASKSSAGQIAPIGPGGPVEPPTQLLDNQPDSSNLDIPPGVGPASTEDPLVPTPPEADAFESLVSVIPTSEMDTSIPIATPPPVPKFGYVKQSLQLREGPGPAYLVVAPLPQNLQVAIIEQEAGWTRVSAGPDAIGWLPKEMVMKNPTPVKKQKPVIKKNSAFPEQQWGR